MLNTVLHGEGQPGRPLIIAHGLFGSARNWGAIAKRMAKARPVVAVDMRNHGDSPHLATHSYADMASDLADVITEHGGIADVLGHSMGGKAAMVLALSHPQTVARLIVADIAPVAYSHTQTGYIDAMEGVDVSSIKLRRDADLALQAQVPDLPTRAFLTQSLDLSGEPARWRLNLPVLRAEMDKIIGFPDVTGSFAGPALFLSGGASDYVKDSHHAGIKALFPNAEFSDIAGAGHWLHAEAPAPFIAALSEFLERTSA
ncbi:alpha/beta fold hydrolase [Tropicimonas sp. S265A]|uniref:alpha/beta fold hydrolase n=1 Tax=Tropicimonas sp. S265A TaxID=3415134 RepID=UPI003C79CF7B